jgi:group I intron endonuclease
MVGIIYSVKNLINNKYYIGQTAHSLKERKDQHIHNSNNGLLTLAIKKYGKENFEWNIIDEGENQEVLNQLERLHISRYESLITQNGYNIREGGGNNYKGDLNKTIVNVNIRMDEKLKGDLKILAVKNRCTLTELITKLLEIGILNI